MMHTMKIAMAAIVTIYLVLLYVYGLASLSSWALCSDAEWVFALHE
jgi:hypothetical protein